MSINDLVSHKNKGKALVRYIGELNSGAGVRYGLELLDQIGKNNGFDKNNNFLFVCALSHGIFAKESSLKLVNKSKIIDFIITTDEPYQSYSGDSGSDDDNDNDNETETETENKNDNNDTNNKNSKQVKNDTRTKKPNTEQPLAIKIDTNNGDDNKKKENDVKNGNTSYNNNNQNEDNKNFFGYGDGIELYHRKKFASMGRRPSKQQSFVHMLSQCMCFPNLK